MDWIDPSIRWVAAKAPRAATALAKARMGLVLGRGACSLPNRRRAASPCGMRRRCVASFLAVPMAVTTSPLYAFPTSRLVYARGEGAESCPSEATARHAVESRLGYDPFSLVADKVIVAEIVRDHGDLRGRVELVDEGGMIQGAREFRTSPAQCDDLVATMALAISIAIDPKSDGAVPASPAASAPVAPKDPPPQSVAVPATAADSRSGAGHASPPVAAELSPAEMAPSPAPGESASDPGEPHEATASANGAEAQSSAALDADEPARPRRASANDFGTVRAHIGAALTSSFGTAPDVAIGVAASVGVRWHDLSLDIEGRGDWPASSPVPTGGTARASLRAGSVVPCVHRGVWFVCGVGVVGSVNGSGQGLVVGREHDALYAAAGARIGAEVPIGGPFFFRPQIDGLANFSPVELQVDDSQVWKASLFSALFGAGVFASFP